MKAYLDKHKVEYPSKAKNSALWELCQKEMEHHPVYKIDKIIEDRGFKVLRLPPYHAELNPIELIWANVSNMFLYNVAM